MRFSSTFLSRAWILAPFCALGLLLWIHGQRVRHIIEVSSLVTEQPVLDRTSPTGYAQETRTLIIPAHHSAAYDWIAQTQRSAAVGDWRIHHVDYDNAPDGRSVRSTAPYRWWLAGVAWCDARWSGRPFGAAVEQSALLADPALHLLLWLSTAIFIARRFGAAPAIVAVSGLATLFPLAASFIPGTPDHHALGIVIAAWSMLLLLAGLHTLDRSPPVRPPETPAVPPMGRAQNRSSAKLLFWLGGFAGGIGLWVSVATQVPIIVGLALGTALALSVFRARSGEESVYREQAILWRWWGAGGALATLAAYIIEYAGSDPGSWELRTVHPLYGIAWAGLGEILGCLAEWRAQSRGPQHKLTLIRFLLASAAVGAIPLTMWLAGNEGFLETDRLAYQLTKLPDGAVASSLLAAFRRGDVAAQLWAIGLPALILIPAIWLFARRKTAFHQRLALAATLGPLAVALGFAVCYLRWWSLVDVALVMLAVVLVMQLPKRRTWWLVASAVLVILGLIQLWPPLTRSGQIAVPLLEVEGMIERDLARWLARRIGAERKRAVVFAPPNLTNTLYYYGDLRGLGTFAPENRDGLSAAVRLAGATTNQEAYALVERHGITHIVVPTWDPYFESTLEARSSAGGASFLQALQRWQLPPWLRPVPYQFSKVSGTEDHFVAVFEVVEEQESSLALSRLAEYLAEMGQLARAGQTSESLERYPADVGALAARAQFAAARSDRAALDHVLGLLRRRLAGGGDRYLAWDRRVSLAIVLAREQDISGSRAQIAQCLSELSEARLRSLSSGMLLNLNVLVEAFGLEITDPNLRRLATELLPAELRSPR